MAPVPHRGGRFLLPGQFFLPASLKPVERIFQDKRQLRILVPAVILRRIARTLAVVRASNAAIRQGDLV